MTDLRDGPRREAARLIREARALRDRGRLRSAEARMAKALNRAIDAGSKPMAAEAHLFLAGLRFSRLSRKEALWHARSAVRLFQDEGDQVRMYRALRLARTLEAFARAG